MILVKNNLKIERIGPFLQMPYIEDKASHKARRPIMLDKTNAREVKGTSARFSFLEESQGGSDQQ